MTNLVIFLTLRYSFLFLSFFFTDLLTLSNLRSATTTSSHKTQPNHSIKTQIRKTYSIKTQLQKPIASSTTKPKNHSILHCKSTPYWKPPPPLKTTAGHKTQRKKKSQNPKQTTQTLDLTTTARHKTQRKKNP
ncbi:hypothetical protein ACB092_10G177900 [Castanea dentata]